MLTESETEDVVKHRMDPEAIADACRDVLDLPLEERLRAAVLRVADLYPDLVDPGRERWIFTKAGGIVGKINFLHASLGEYLLLFGAPVATYGFSGRYNHVEISKVVLAGRYTTYDPESAQIEPGVFEAGDLVTLPKGRVRNMEIASGSWHFEYGRGPVVTAMPFGTVDLLVSSLEVRPILQTTVDYTHFISAGIKRRLGRRAH